jgi:iron(III) transport system ATP-binding protein
MNSRATQPADPVQGPPQSTFPAVDVADLTKAFGSKVAVDNVGLEVAPGQFVVLLGPSGSGKTTLLRCIAGIERPSAGRIRIGGVEMDSPGTHLPPEKRDLAMVFQDYALWPHMTAEQNVSFALRRRRLNLQERRTRSVLALAQVGLAGLEGRYPGQLSGGEQQRVALARALVAEPSLLLFDEPLSNLDADRREHLRVDIGAMVRRLGAAAVYITHDQAEAFALADVVGVLDQGRLVQLAAPETVYRDPASEFVARFTGLAGELEGVAADFDGTHLTVDVSGHEIYGRPMLGEAPERGTPVRVLIRPTAAHFGGSDGRELGGRFMSPAQSPAPGLSAANGSGQTRNPPSATLDAVALDSAFRGWGYDHVIELAGGRRLSGIPNSQRLRFESRAQIVLSADGCLVFATSQPTRRARL